MSKSIAASAATSLKIVRVVALIFVAALAIASILAYLANQAAPVGGADLYAGLRRQASFNYYLVWLIVSLIAFLIGLQRRSLLLPLIFLVPVLLEGVAYASYFAAHHRPYAPVPPILSTRFDSHPNLIAVPRPGNFGVGITHDSDERRTTINTGKAGDPRLIYVFGGSATYGVGNVDADTWPSRLSAALGPNYAVTNFGVPAFSSMETMLQSLFVTRDRPPACAVYYFGSSDLRNAHVTNLRVDYSDMELPYVASLLEPGKRHGLLGTYSLFLSFIGSILHPQTAVPPAAGTLDSDPDKRLMGIFHRNIQLISLIDEYFGVKPVFVPGVMDYGRLTSDGVGSLPFVKEKDSRALMDLMNNEMKTAAGEAGAAYVDAALAAGWTDADFIDEANFSAAGTDKLAKSIVGDISRLCQ